MDELLKLRSFRFGNLDADQHPAVVGAVITVVKQADIPAVRHPGQKFQQGARSFRELEAVQQLVANIGRMAAHHVADM